MIVRSLRRLTSTWRGRLLLRVVFYSAVVFGGLPLACSQVLVKTIRQPTGRPPLGYEESWVVSEGLRLRTWTVRGDPARAAAVVVHGLGDTLESYLEVAFVLNRRGHTVLLLDLRGHGRSEGRYTTLGGREREDVRAAMWLLRERGLAANGFILAGYSMGAVAVLRAAAVEPDVKAVVVEAPFDTLRGNVSRFPVPRWLPILPIAIAIAEWRAGYDADDVDAVAAARNVRAPLLAIADGGQPDSEPEVRRIYDAHPGPKALWVAPGVEHVAAIFARDYWPQVLGFLEKNGI